MCGLYSFRRSPEEVRSLFSGLETPGFPPRDYVAPASPVPIVRMVHGKRQFALVRWGLIPSWVKEVTPGRPLINARAETVLEKASFRNAMKRRRCLMPADGFYEWKGDVPGKKQAYHVHRQDNGLFAFAGLWEQWMGADGSEIDSAVLITTTPNATLAPIHNRMPAVIAPQDFDTWLDAERIDAKEAHRLLQPANDDYFVAEPVTLARPRSTVVAKPVPDLGKDEEPKLL